MRWIWWSGGVASVFAAGVAAGAWQQPAQTRREPQFENEHVRVWKSIIMPNQPLALHRHGLFTWKEWADTLAARIAAAQAAGDPDVGDTYYRHWLAALETIVAAKGASTPRELERHRLAWERAAQRTRHGQPIVLRPADFRD